MCAVDICIELFCDIARKAVSNKSLILDRYQRRFTGEVFRAKLLMQNMRPTLNSLCFTCATIKVDPPSLLLASILHSRRKKEKKRNTRSATPTSIVPDFHEFLRLRDVT